MPRIKETTIDVTKDNTLLLPLIARLDTCLLLALSMLFQRLYHYTRKRNLTPTRLCLRLTFYIPKFRYPGHSTTNIYHSLFKFHAFPSKRKQLTTSITS